MNGQGPDLQGNGVELRVGEHVEVSPEKLSDNNASHVKSLIMFAVLRFVGLAYTTRLLRQVLLASACSPLFSRVLPVPLVFVFMAGLAMLAPLPAQAASVDGMALARSNVCLGCHQVDSRRVGPPFRSIGQRYAQGDDRAATLDYLVATIQKGGRGKWGAIGMPAQPQVSAQDARALAQWILSLAE